jgi:hypothetical protein
MTFLDPTTLLPRYENDAGSDQMRACWPGLVAVARTPSVAAKCGAFHELSPLPGGFFLGGVGCVDDGSRFREQVLAHLSAGTDLEEALCTAVRSPSTMSLSASACYARFDPLEATFRIEGVGPHVSAAHLTAGRGRLLPKSFEDGGGPVTVALRPGEALALVAHPRAWDKHVLAAVIQALPEDFVAMTEVQFEHLSAVLDAIPGPSARLLLYRSDGAGAPKIGSSEDLLMPTGELNVSWTDADREFIDELAGSLV